MCLFFPLMNSQTIIILAIAQIIKYLEFISGKKVALYYRLINSYYCTVYIAHNLFANNKTSIKSLFCSVSKIIIPFTQ